MNYPIDSRRVAFPATTAAAMCVALVGAALLWSQTAFVAMRCSGEQKTCIAKCTKSLDRASISTCVTNCGARQLSCMKTGCWDSGAQRYCGLLKQQARIQALPARGLNYRHFSLATAAGLYEFLIPPRVHSKWTLTNCRFQIRGQPERFPMAYGRSPSNSSSSSTARSRIAPTSADQPCCATSPIFSWSDPISIPTMRSI